MRSFNHLCGFVFCAFSRMSQRDDRQQFGMARTPLLSFTVLFSTLAVALASADGPELGRYGRALPDDGGNPRRAAPSSTSRTITFDWRRSLLNAIAGEECNCDKGGETNSLASLLDDRIVGGIEVDPPFKYPFIVNLARFNQLEFCGGSLISPTVVLTAAHCDKPGTYVWIGRHDLRDRDEWDKASQSYQVIDKAYSTPKWDSATNDNDIMLMLLDRPVDVSRFPPILLDDGLLTGDVETDGIRVTAMGWGATEWQGRRSSTLREVTVTGFPRDQCNGAAMYDGLITSNMLCAATFGKDSCQGDSGGPLIASVEEQGFRPDLDTREPVQVGVVSWGLRCAALEVELENNADQTEQTGFPGVYVRLSNYKHMIKTQLTAWESEPARFVSEKDAEDSEVRPGDRGVPGGPKCGGKEHFSDPGNSGTCATSKDGQGKCMNNGGYTFQDAEESCQALGARLCTESELMAGEGRGTGCGLDKKGVWTSTACSGGTVIALGGPGDLVACAETSSSVSDGVRCCY